MVLVRRGSRKDEHPGARLLVLIEGNTASARPMGGRGPVGWRRAGLRRPRAACARPDGAGNPAAGPPRARRGRGVGVATLDPGQRGQDLAVRAGEVGPHDLLHHRVRARMQRCRPGRSATGPVQSWGATGRWYASARAAILRASVRPPTQPGSNITICTPSRAASRKPGGRRAPRCRPAASASRGELAPAADSSARRILEPERLVLLGRAGDPAGARQRPARAHLERIVDPVADRAPDPPQRLEPALEVVALDVPAAALAGSRTARSSSRGMPSSSRLSASSPPAARTWRRGPRTARAARPAVPQSLAYRTRRRCCRPASARGPRPPSICQIGRPAACPKRSQSATSTAESAAPLGAERAQAAPGQASQCRSIWSGSWPSRYGAAASWM